MAPEQNRGSGVDPLGEAKSPVALRYLDPEGAHRRQIPKHRIRDFAGTVDLVGVHRLQQEGLKALEESLPLGLHPAVGVGPQDAGGQVAEEKTTGKGRVPPSRLPGRLREFESRPLAGRHPGGIDGGGHAWPVPILRTSQSRPSSGAGILQRKDVGQRIFLGWRS